MVRKSALITMKHKKGRNSMKKITLILCVVLIASMFAGCAERKKGKLGTLTVTVSDEWKKAPKSKTEDTSDYLLEYKKGTADLKIEAVYEKEVGDLYDFEENLAAGYEEKENELIEVDSKQGIIFNFDDKMILHVPTEKIFYIITFKKSNDTPESFEDIIKHIKFKEKEK